MCISLVSLYDLSSSSHRLHVLLPTDPTAIATVNAPCSYYTSFTLHKRKHTFLQISNVKVVNIKFVWRAKRKQGSRPHLLKLQRWISRECELYHTSPLGCKWSAGSVSGIISACNTRPYDVWSVGRKLSLFVFIYEWDLRRTNCFKRMSVVIKVVAREMRVIMVEMIETDGRDTVSCNIYFYNNMHCCCNRCIINTYVTRRQ